MDNYKKAATIASRIAKAAESIGLTTSIDQSRVSCSTYVTVTDETVEEGSQEWFEIRISNHESTASAQGIVSAYVWVDDTSWADAVVAMAAKFDRPVPANARRSLALRAAKEEAARKEQDAFYAARAQDRADLGDLNAKVAAWAGDRWTNDPGKKARQTRRELRRAYEVAMVA